jgi:hypothetical protein
MNYLYLATFITSAIITLIIANKDQLSYNDRIHLILSSIFSFISFAWFVESFFK